MQANAAYQIRKTSKKLIVTLDREMVDEERVLDWLNFLKLEYLVRKASFGAEIEEMGKKSTAAWWEKNKSKLLPPHEL
jgi:hypothetical protein